MDLNIIKKSIKAIDKFNEELARYVAVSGDSELPIIDCTVVGTEPVQPYKYKVLKTMLKVTDLTGDEIVVRDEYDAEELRESLKYDKRRLNKAWRVWKSENPDAELERDTDDDE